MKLLARSLTAVFVTTLTACAGAVSNLPVSAPSVVQPGYVKVQFDVAAPLNFAKYQYSVVFNTSGNKLTPGANAQGADWAAYSVMLEVAGSGGAPSAQVVAFVKHANPHIPPYVMTLATTPAQFEFNPNSNGAGTEFTILFQRSIFNQNLASSSPVAATWLFNAFTAQANGEHQWSFVDSMGGRCANCFVSPKLPVDTAFERTVAATHKPQGIDPSAKIVDVKIVNNP